MGRPVAVADSQRKVLKQPTANDLKKIAAKFNALSNDGYEETDLLLDGLYFLQTAHDLGFELSDADSTKVRELIEKRLEREEKREQARLDQKFQGAIHAILAACRDCRSTDIRPKYTQHYREHGRQWQTLDLLFCGSCNRVYYSEELTKLEERCSIGEFIDKSRLPEHRRRRRC